MKRYIGVFDSGIGGLTVVKHLKEQLIDENIIFLADNKNLPYGNKTNEEILNLVLNDVSFLYKYPLKALIIACNTADSVAYEELSALCDVEVFGVIKPTARYANKVTKNHKIGLLATPSTIKNKKYPEFLHNLNPNNQLFEIACEDLAKIIENGDVNKKSTKELVDSYMLKLLKNDIDTLILGCTHYDLLSSYLETKHPNLNIVSSSSCIAYELKKLQTKDKDNINEQLYFATADTSSYKDFIKNNFDDTTFTII